MGAAGLPHGLTIELTSRSVHFPPVSIPPRTSPLAVQAGSDG
jgi:hypothetical protein